MNIKYRVRKLETPIRQVSLDSRGRCEYRWTTEPRYAVEEQIKKWFGDGFKWSRVLSYNTEGTMISLECGGLFGSKDVTEDFMERYIRIEHPEIVRMVEVEV